MKYLRMMNVSWMAAMTLAVGLVLVSPARAADNSDPNKLIQSVAQEMLKDLEANRAAYHKDPKQINALVDKLLLPHFDVQYAAQRVLGQSWRTATPEQRDRFIKAFYQSLVQNYGTALAEFTADRLVVLPFRGEANADRATVRTQIKRNDGTRVDVNYSMRKAADGWKAWDVSIEGISYVKNFKDDFGAQIDSQGLESVIKRLETEGVKPAAKQTTKQSSGKQQ